MAADALGYRPFTIADLTSELDAGWGEGDRLAVVETAGGVRSPVASDGDSLILASAIAATDVVVVADAGLGTINSVRLAVDALLAAALPSPLVMLNRFDGESSHDTHARNLAWLRDRDRLDVVTDVGTLAGILAGRVGLG